MRHTVSSLTEFMDWLKVLDYSVEKKEYLFRGVSSKSYDAGQASAYRRLKAEDRESLQNLLKVNRDLIDEARFRNFDKERYKRELSDLELLGELQHFRAATCLIDFTFEPGVALWFACQPSSKEGEDNKDGKVIAVRNDNRIKEVGPEDLSGKKKFEDFFKADEHGKYPLYCWQPEGITNRAEHQKSVFLFGNAKIEAADECIIDKNTYDDYILRTLYFFYNIGEELLFPDFDGFTQRNAQDIPYSLDPYTIGYQAYRRGHYEKTIESFTEAIRQKGNALELCYYWRGKSRAKLCQREEAKQDFQNALQLARDKDYLDDFITIIEEAIAKLKS